MKRLFLHVFLLICLFSLGCGAEDSSESPGEDTGPGLEQPDAGELDPGREDIADFDAAPTEPDEPDVVPPDPNEPMEDVIARADEAIRSFDEIDFLTRDSWENLRDATFLARNVLDYPQSYEDKGPDYADQVKTELQEVLASLETVAEKEMEMNILLTQAAYVQQKAADCDLTQAVDAARAVDYRADADEQIQSTMDSLEQAVNDCDYWDIVLSPVEDDNLEQLMDALGDEANKRILLKAGVYPIDVRIKKKGDNLFLKGEDRYLKFEEGAHIQVIPNDLGNVDTKYTVLTLQDLINSMVVGVRITGEMDEHLGEGGEFAAALRIEGNSINTVVKDAQLQNMWGDGAAVSAERTKIYGPRDNKSHVRYRGSRNVIFKDFFIDHCGRNGISIVGTDGIIVRDGTIRDVKRTYPKDGIDMEIYWLKGAFEGEEAARYKRIDHAPLKNVIIEDMSFEDIPTFAVHAFSHTENIKVRDIFVKNKDRGGAVEVRVPDGVQHYSNIRGEDLSLGIRFWKTTTDYPILAEDLHFKNLRNEGVAVRHCSGNKITVRRATIDQTENRAKLDAGDTDIRVRGHFNFEDSDDVVCEDCVAIGTNYASFRIKEDTRNVELIRAKAINPSRSITIDDNGEHDDRTISIIDSDFSDVLKYKVHFAPGTKVISHGNLPEEFNDFHAPQGVVEDIKVKK